MKKLFMSISLLVVSLSMTALLLCSATICPEASSKFVYHQSEKAEIVYTLNEAEKRLPPRWEPEYTSLIGNQSTTKVIYNKKLNGDCLSYIFYKWDQREGNREINQPLLFEQYLATNATSVN